MTYDRKIIDGFDNVYEVDTLGNVFVVKYVNGEKKSRKLKPAVLKNGYKQVKLFDGDGKQHGMYVHRLVAITFLPNPESKQIVNHKDCNRANCDISNLEWATQSENMRHAWAMKRARLAGIVLDSLSILDLELLPVLQLC